jgi:hypothetical protein
MLVIFILPTEPKVVAFKVITVLAVSGTIINYIVLIYRNWGSDYVIRPCRNTTVDL